MCHDADSRAPIPDPPVTTATGADDILTAGDGARFRIHLATPDEAAATAILVLPDVRGVHDFYRDLALQLAQQGHCALVVDYFGRSAGPDAREGDDFDYMAHLPTLTMAGLADDFATALAHLRAASGGKPAFTLGFCFGGRQSYMAGALGLGLAGSIGFYGAVSEQRGMPGALDLVDQLSNPILGLQAGLDEQLNADVPAFQAALSDRGIAHEFVVYPGAPHSFFDRKYEAHADTCADAWARVKRFLAEHSPAAATAADR